MNKKYIFFVGIKGVGMTALAVYCKERGYKVAGSDIPETFQTDQILRQFSIPVFEEFNKKNITSDINLVIYSGAYDINKHPEVNQAFKMGIKVISHGEALGKFMREQKGISVAGTHGKTTSTALLATILDQAKLDPSYVIGCAGVNSLASSGHFGKGEYFIAEADEYQTAVNFEKKSRFLWQNPFAVLLTNIDYDHPDVFKNIEEVKSAFNKLILKIPKTGLLVYNGDDKNVIDIVKNVKCNLISFGEKNSNRYFVKKALFADGKAKLTIQTPEGETNFFLNIPGKHNCLNVCGVYALASNLGLSDEIVTYSITKFTGTKRRFEKKSLRRGITYYDDYAHHPTEISKTLAAARVWFPKNRIVVVFQPHTFSRTQFLLKEFANAFGNADIVIITDIFSSAREQKGDFNISGEKLVSAIKKKHNKVYYANSISQVIQYLKQMTKTGDVVFTMGAGNIYKLHEKIK